MKNILKKFIAVVLVVTTLTMLFCISSDAIQIYGKVYRSGNNKLLEVFLYDNYGIQETPQAEADLKIYSLSTYDFAVYACGITGTYFNTNVPFDTYTTLQNQYNAKFFDTDDFTSVENTVMHYIYSYASNVVCDHCGVVYVAGKKSNSYSSTYNNRLVEIDPDNLIPITIKYFSNISGECVYKLWNGVD